MISIIKPDIQSETDVCPNTAFICLRILPWGNPLPYISEVGETELLPSSDQNLFSAEENVLCHPYLKPSSSHWCSGRHSRLFHSTLLSCRVSSDLRGWTETGNIWPVQGHPSEWEGAFVPRIPWKKKLSTLMSEIKLSRKLLGLSKFNAEIVSGSSSFTCLWGTESSSFSSPVGFTFSGIVHK